MTMTSFNEIAKRISSSTLIILTRFLLPLALVSSILLLKRTPRFLGPGNPNDNPRIAFVYLSSSLKSDIDNLNCSLKTVQSNFNERYGYRVIVAHEDIQQDIQDNLSARYPVEFRQVNLAFDKALNKSYGYPINPSMSRRSKWGYQNMCRFWFTGIFRNHSVLEGLDYYVRMDTDSTLTKKIGYDFIREFVEEGVSYGHHDLSHDCGKVVHGLRDFALSYAESNVNITGPSRWDLVLNPRLEKRCVPMYYNNLEFVNIRRFKDDEGIRRWEAAVDKNGGIYWYRWGDAPLRYITAALFLKNDEVRFLNLIGYKHKFSPEICLE